ncbi:MAG: ANTAR domain-containing protein [Acholeplasmatales bacterium]|nr:ANTAR domain-containing protein [Acholeplasmatales bacterium]
MLDRIFSVLLVTSSKNFSNGILSALSETNYEVTLSETVQKAKRMLVEKDFDIIIVNCPVIDDFGMEFAIDEAIRDISGIILFVTPELESEAYYKTCEYGILTLVKPTSKGILLQTLMLLSATIIKKESMREKPKNLKARLEEIKIINTAKMLLIEHKHISEDEAHKYLEKRAMNLRKSKVKIASEIIEEYIK